MNNNSIFGGFFDFSSQGSGGSGELRRIPDFHKSVQPPPDCTSDFGWAWESENGYSSLKAKWLTNPKNPNQPLTIRDLVNLVKADPEMVAADQHGLLFSLSTRLNKIASDALKKERNIGLIHPTNIYLAVQAGKGGIAQPVLPDLGCTGSIPRNFDQVVLNELSWIHGGAEAVEALTKNPGKVPEGELSKALGRFYCLMMAGNTTAAHSGIVNDFKGNLSGESLQYWEELVAGQRKTLQEVAEACDLISRALSTEDQTVLDDGQKIVDKTDNNKWILYLLLSTTALILVGFFILRYSQSNNLATLLNELGTNIEILINDPSNKKVRNKIEEQVAILEQLVNNQNDKDRVLQAKELLKNHDEIARMRVALNVAIDQYKKNNVNPKIRETLQKASDALEKVAKLEEDKALVAQARKLLDSPGEPDYIPRLRAELKQAIDQFMKDRANPIFRESLQKAADALEKVAKLEEDKALVAKARELLKPVPPTKDMRQQLDKAESLLREDLLRNKDEVRNILEGVLAQKATSGPSPELQPLFIWAGKLLEQIRD